MTKYRSKLNWLWLPMLISCAAPPVERSSDNDPGNADDAEGDGDGDAPGDDETSDDGADDQDASDTDGSSDDGPDTDDGGELGGAFPFPQERQLPHCTRPDVAAPQVRAAYDRWKSEAMVADGAGGFLRVRRWEDGDDTVSEGIAYGMLAAVYMNDQTTFDALWEYGRLHTNKNGFMHWRISAAGVEIDHTGGGIGYEQRGGATDADEDMAWALVMAHHQWGGHGALDQDYLTLAREMIDRIWRHEVDHNGGKVLKPGDLWGGWTVTNPSYFSPAFYRVFGRITGNEGAWNEVIDANYTVLEKSAHDVTGLVPAWCNGDGGTANMDYTYQYDACRTPFRIALDYCLFGEPRAGAFLRKIGGFFRGIGASSIGDGYDLSGQVLSQNRSMAFVGPAGAAGLVGGELAGFATDVYAELLVLGAKPRTEGYSYYNASWGVLSLLLMSGNFLDYSQL
jgi:hypothetical protein